MSTQRQYATTPVDELRTHREDLEGGDEILVSDWCDYHDVYMAFLPFDYREANTVEMLHDIQACLEDLHDYTQTFLLKDAGLNHYAGRHMIQRLLRIFRIRDLHQTSKGVRYLNPHYAHYDACIDPITEIEARKSFYQRWHTIPTVDTEWFATHFGHSTSRFRNWVRDREGYPSVRKQQKANKQRLVRTLHTIRTWTDYSQARLYRLIPINESTLRTWQARYVGESDWQPPERPTHKPWFRRATA